MLVFRGRAATIEADRAASERLRSVAAGGEPAVRVWIPHRQVAFGRRDANRDGYGRAREAARTRSFPPVQRDVGGRAVAYDGETTIAFARAEPVEDLRQGTADRYERTTAAVECALSSVGCETERGEPDGAFCPGTHSLSIPDSSPDRPSSRKVVGIAQRVRRDAAMTAGIAVVDAREEIVDVLEAVYDALEVPFDPDAVGAIAAGGDDVVDPEAVRSSLERALVGDDRPRIRPIADLEPDSVESGVE
ncbi:lipoyl protein ligase domain-containing protein [Natrarchaeobius chitinivorans]|uniref:Lipoate--protein ligase family protein n=1 Tax=Natrarchaeobius chitinivorans TaxID=1679083 RepID=A0A3N6M6S2_NATCH|nr:lipoate--protein ligase family protein [Natrarchaeobius chitinivorans]RQG91800.1 lipoate--protein ligase family protein [Natrarchaeobius chitinivorans]